MSITNPEVTERMALGPEQGGQAQRLVESCGISRGAAHAARWVLANVPEAVKVTGTPVYAGRGEHGGLVYMVTYTTENGQESE